MEPTSLTIEILKSIRDEVKSVRDEVKSVRDEVKSVRDEVQGLRGEVAAVREQQVHSEIRIATELVAFVGEFRALRECGGR